MSKQFTLGQLTEGIRDRNVGQDGGRLINKWTRTGLLRGLNEHKRENMARLLETKQLKFFEKQINLPTATLMVSQISHSQSFVVYSVDWLLMNQFLFSQ